MPLFRTSKHISVPADVAFAVAADVAAYREFLPLLKRSTIRGQKVSTVNGQRFDAELAVEFSKLGLAESFVSRVETDEAARSVRAGSSDAPFRKIETQWTITPRSAGCDVEISIDYTFRNPLLQVVAGGFMDMAITKVMAAFETRAIEIQRAASKSS